LPTTLTRPLHTLAHTTLTHSPPPTLSPSTTLSFTLAHTLTRPHKLSRTRPHKLSRIQLSLSRPHTPIPHLAAVATALPHRRKHRCPCFALPCPAAVLPLFCLALPCIALPPCAEPCAEPSLPSEPLPAPRLLSSPASVTSVTSAASVIFCVRTAPSCSCLSTSCRCHLLIGWIGGQCRCVAHIALSLPLRVSCGCTSTCLAPCGAFPGFSSVSEGWGLHSAEKGPDEFRQWEALAATVIAKSSLFPLLLSSLFSLLSSLLFFPFLSFSCVIGFLAIVFSWLEARSCPERLVSPSVWAVWAAWVIHSNDRGSSRSGSGSVNNRYNHSHSHSHR
jgi:hypothetical protein